MLNDETIRLILEMTGSQSIEEVTRKLEEQKRMAGELAASYDTLERQVGEYAVAEESVSKRTKQASEDKARSLAILNQFIDESVAEHKALATATTDTHRANEAMGRGILQTSYAVQDFTSVLANDGGLARALGSVQNNIPLLLTSLGVGAGLAGTVSLVAVGLGAAIPLLNQFSEAEDKASDATKKLADQVARLSNIRTPQEEEGAKNVEEFIRSQPGAVVAQGIKASLTSRARSQAAANVREQLDKFGVVTETEEQQLERWAPQIQADADRLLAGMPSNQQDMAFVMSLAQEAPGNFPRGFAQGLAGAAISPQQREKQLDAERKAEEEIRRAQEKRVGTIKDRIEDRQRVAEKERRSRDDLTMEGKRNEDAWRNGVDRDKERDFREGAASADAEARAIQAEEREKARKAKEAARNNTAEARLRREADKTEENVTSEAMRQWNAGGRRESPQQLQAIIRNAIASLPEAGGDIAAAIQQAVMMDRQRMRAQMMRQFGRMQAQSEQYGY